MKKPRNKRVVSTGIAWVQAVIVLALLRVVSWISWTGIWRLGAWMGPFVFWLDGKRKGVAVANLREAYGDALSEEEIRNIALDSYRNACRFYLESAKLHHASAQDLLSRFRLLEDDRIRKLFDRGSGLVVVTAHLGNFEFLGKAVGAMGYRYGAVYRPLDNPILDRKVREARSREGAILIPRQEMFKGVRSALKDGRAVAFLADQNAGKSGVFVPFFGRLASTTPAPAIFSMATGAPILPLICCRERPGQFVGISGDPIFPEAQGEAKGEDLRGMETRLAEQYTQALEALVRAYPKQWFWFHKRWRTRPPTEKSEAAGEPSATEDLSVSPPESTE